MSASKTNRSDIWIERANIEDAERVNRVAIDVAEVDQALSDAGIAPSLRAALERLDGPIVHRETELRRIRDSWASVLAGCTHTDLIAYLSSPLNFGVLI